MGFGVHLFGHHPAIIIKNIQKINEESWGLGPLNPLMFKLAHGIKKLTGIDRMAFFNTGTEAIMVAIRVARAYSNKNKIVLFKGAYHGHNDTTLVFKTDPMSNQPLPLIPGIPETTQADTFLLEFDSDASLEFINDHSDEIAAVLTEPVQSRNPGCQPVEFLRQLHALTKEKDIALIFDEIITGFRIHPGGAQAYFDIEADIVTYGKVIGGGMPIGIVAGKAAYLNMIDGGNWKYDDDSLPDSKKTFVAGTFCNHPLSMAAAYAVVELLQEKGYEITNQLNQLTLQLVGEINEWMQKENIPIELACFGSLFRIKVPTVAKIFFHQLLLEGLYIWEGKTCFLSTAHSKEDMEKIKKTIKKCAMVLKSCGYFPSSFQKDKEASTISPLAVLCQENTSLNISLNIGISLKVKGEIDPEFLEMAISYVTIGEAAFRTLNSDSLITRKQIQSEEETDEQLQHFINQDILKSGLAYLMLYKDSTLIHVAMSGHKSKLDGWSLTILLSRIMGVYRALSEGNQLPDISEDKPSIDVPELSSPSTVDYSISEMEKISYKLDTPYSKIKRTAKELNSDPLQFFRAAFALAYKRSISQQQESIGIGTPVAGQLKYGKSDAVGPFTFIEARQYNIKQFKTLNEYIENEPPISSEKISFIVNLDRMVGNTTQDSFSLIPTPLDPSYIRYDIILNILAVREDGLLIDMKWRKSDYPEKEMNSMITNFNDLILK